MTEKALHDFLEDRIDEKTFAQDLSGSHTVHSKSSTQYRIEQLDDTESFEITTSHLLKLCQAVLDNQLNLQDLNTIAFALNFSDFFDWDGGSKMGERVSRALFAWDNHIIDVDLARDNITKWMHYLKTGEELFDLNEIKRKMHR